MQFSVAVTLIGTFFSPFFIQLRPVKAKPSDTSTRTLRRRRMFLRPQGRFGSQKVLSALAFLCGSTEAPFFGTVGSLGL